MANWTDEDFLKSVEEEYPDTDWNNLPDLDSSPSHWEIDGMQHRRRVFLGSGSEQRDTIGFGISKEYPTKEAAAGQVEKMKTDELWNQETISHDGSNEPIPSIEYYGPVIWNSIEIRECKSGDLVAQHIYKGILEDISDGKKVFPMYLP